MHDEDAWIRRSAARQPGPAPAPPLVEDVLHSAGQPMDPPSRRYMEARFGYDFSGVRIHADARAADSARTIGSLAYSAGNDIVFGAGQYQPGTPRTARLLAHELTHVAQQHGRGVVEAKLTVGAAGTPAEREADAISAQVLNEEQPAVREGTDASTIQRALVAGCPEVTTAQDTAAVAGIGVPAHNAIERYVRGQVGARFWREAIPQASSTPLRTEDPSERRRRSRTGIEIIRPQQLGGRAGTGTPDLGYKGNGIVELAEVKPALWPVVVEGEAQNLNYIEKGDAPENAGWRTRRGITGFTIMPETRVTWPSSLETERGDRIAVGWCLPGVAAYRLLSADEAETIICGVSDQKAIDKLLNIALDRGQGMVDEFIDTAVDKQITGAIQTLSIRQGLQMLSTYARGALVEYAEKQIGPGTGAVVVGLLPDEALVDSAATWLQQQVGTELESLLRQLVLKAKTELLSRVRKYIKDRLRTYLQESLAAVCATVLVGATVSLAALLKQLAKDLAKMFGEAVVEVAKEWAIALAKELVKTVVIALLVAVAVVAIIFFLPEILAFLAAAAEIIGTALAVGGAAALAFGDKLFPLIEDLIPAIIENAPAVESSPAFQFAR